MAARLRIVNRASMRRLGWVVQAALIVLAAGLTVLSGQNSSPPQPLLDKARKLLAVQCAGCHGADARGGEHGPPLAGARRLRARSVEWLRRVIHDGIPSGGMPAFNLSTDDLNALAALIRALNMPAAEASVPGDRNAGELFFFGQGRCASCHMVYGRGSSVGPDLSHVGQEMTVEEIRTSLLDPSASITPGYQTVRARLRDGKTLQGFVRSRSNFEIVLQDLKGNFHLLREDAVEKITPETKSPMPMVNVSPEELQNLIAYLSGLTGTKAGLGKATETVGPGDISFSRILHPKPGDWLTYNGNLNGNRYSELTQINSTNVGQLRLKWIFTVPLWKQFLPDNAYFNENMKYFGLEVTPLVADGIMYVTGPHQAFALDASTGQEIWAYWRPRSQMLAGDAALGTNRGMAILGDKVFMVTDNAHLIALNRTTGEMVWEAVMPDEPMHYGSTVAPLVVDNMVIAGVSGGDWGIRGFIGAYRASDGKRLWRRWSIPAKGEPAAGTWGGNPPKTGGGATWSTGSYDPETNTLFWPTGNPYPDSDDRARPGDNLYTDCILALNPENGRLKWYYQVTPHDTHDWDSNAPLVLVDTTFQGQQRKLLLHADKNGFFYVLDRTNGRLLLARPFVRVTWASGIGANGRPQLVPMNGLLCPGNYGTNWNATAFNPVDHLYYVMALEKCVMKLSSGNWKTPRATDEAGEKYLEAIDIDTGKVVWKKPQIGPAEGKRDAGVLATAGGIVFYGDPSGDVVAADSQNGKTLWHFPTNGENKASPMTYMVGGKQYVALAVGPNILCFGLP